MEVVKVAEPVAVKAATVALVVVATAVATVVEGMAVARVGEEKAVGGSVAVERVAEG